MEEQPSLPLALPKDPTESEILFDLVYEATSQAIEAHLGGLNLRLSKRMLAGKITFVDSKGRTVREVPVASMFRKITSVREKLRVLEQKLNNHPRLTVDERAELQAHMSKCYGSLTTFNFLFREEDDKFKGTGS